MINTMSISDYISSEDKKFFCDKCMDCVCTRSCVIYRKAEFEYDKNEYSKEGD